MRRDKTFKVCANHYVDPDISLKPHGGSDRAWVWNTFADFADGEEESQKQLFAIRFLNEENANKFKDKFTECQDIVTRLKKSNSKENSEKEDKCDEIKTNMNIINDGIDKLTVKEKPKTDSEDKDSNANDDVASPVEEKSEKCNNDKNCNEDKQPDNTNSNKPNNDLNTSSENSATKRSENENAEEDEPEKNE
jgi:Ran-binding protein 1